MGIGYSRQMLSEVEVRVEKSIGSPIGTTVQGKR
jgi:hypothetical protein